MNYAEMIERAMKGRSVNSLAKAWGVQQRTLDRYVKGQSMPDYTTGLKIAREAGINTAEAFEIFAAAEENHRVKNFKLQMGFARTGFLAVLAGIAMAVTLFLTTSTANAVNMQVAEQAIAGNINYAKYDV
jgi:predicted transcriptional regulator